MGIKLGSHFSKFKSGREGGLRGRRADRTRSRSAADLNCKCQYTPTTKATTLRLVGEGVVAALRTYTSFK